MIIGYSFWGFLGDGITETPDGGRSHRKPLVDGIAVRGHQLVFLQADRDRIEAGDRLGDRYSFSAGLPEIDLLFLEWRWEIPGRNTTPCGVPGHTCDLHRQTELLHHYTVRRRTPTVIWDKDRQLPADSPWRRHRGVVVCEAALEPRPGARRLLFPVDDALLDRADPEAMAEVRRPLVLSYVGNQYDRDEPFDAYFSPAARIFPHQVAGRWTDTRRWPHVRFTGRIPFPQVGGIYSESLATMMLLPRRYAQAGQMTQRIFEAVLAGCLPLAPADIRQVDRFVPGELVVRDAADAVRRLTHLRAEAGGGAHVRLLAECLQRLDLFRLSSQLQAVDEILGEATDQARRPVACESNVW